MRTPWVVALSGDVLLVEPERWLFAPGAWGEVEAALGTALPADYKDLIGDGLACVFGDELVIASPFDPNPHTNLIHMVAHFSWGLAYLRALDPTFAVLAYPEVGGLLAWGTDGGGGNHHWDTSQAEPERWTICVEGRPIDGIEHHNLSLTHYLEGLRSGDIPAAALSGWPAPSATIRRREA
jgi:hypothetical protein